MFIKNWKPLAVLAVFIWSICNLFQVLPDTPGANPPAPGSLQYYEHLASLSPTDLQNEIGAKLSQRPDWNSLNQFQREELEKEQLDDASFGNNMQPLWRGHGHAVITSLKLGLDLRGGSQLLLKAEIPDELKKKGVTSMPPEVMRQVQTVIDNRVNSLGVSETVVQRTGADRLIVELPGVKDPQEAKDRIGTTALLEFKEMAYDANGTPLRDPSTGGPVWKDVGLTGKDFQRAQAVPMPGGQNWRITFQFKPEGAKKFGDLTSRLVGKQIGIFLDGLPTERGTDGRPLPMTDYRGINVREPIRGGDGEITGSFTKDQAIDLAMKLNAGSLPTKIDILEERTVGATLGQDSIQKSLVAGGVGITCVMAFMVLIYGVPGLVADIALILYTLTTLAIFKTIPVTLTLAGIAGFILSVGMAVDANILIFERTKEELKAGKNLYTAIEDGFDRAFSSIFDSNMNSLIACVVLMIFGTSIVKGFAVTLAIGVAVSMFTAITATRVLLHLIPRSLGLFGHKYQARKTTLASAKVTSEAGSESKQKLFGSRT
jgi:preprotein translocase subunit SecD